MNAKSLVDRGLEIRARIEQLKEELEVIEEHLEIMARNGVQIELEDPEREGRQFLAHGTELTVPVVLTADLIRQSFTDDSEIHKAMAAAADDKLPEFYRKVAKWEILAKTGKAFRSQAAEILGAKAPAFITAALARDKHGIPKSSIKVEWDRTTPVAK